MRRAGRIRPPRGADGAAGAHWERRLLGLHSLLIYLFLYLPIAILVLFSFNQAKQTAVWSGFTFDWYRAALRDEVLLHAVRNSVIVAVATTLIATVIGTLAALALSRYEFRGRGGTQVLLYLPVVIPEIVLGAALVTFFGAVELRLSLLTVILAHVVFSVSYVAIVVRARLAGLDPALEEAARDLGAGPFETFRRVTLPLALPGILASSLLVFTLSIDDFVITSFVSGVGASTLPLHIYSMLKVGVTPEINAISTLLLAVTLVPIILAQRLLQDSSEGGKRP